jgi:tetratricopeptide (TPR) repeat protein
MRAGSGTTSGAIAAAVVAVIVAGTFSGGEVVWPIPIGSSWFTSETLREAKLPPQDWPVCTSMATESEADLVQLDTDFAAGKKALAAEDWSGAIAALNFAAMREPRNANIQNYLGYAHQRLHQFGPAIGHYQQAVMLNPRSRGAHAHLGKLYLTLGEPGAAGEHLARLEAICLISCREYEELKRAIDVYGKLVVR